MGQLVENLRKEGGFREESILGVGLGVPGLITSDHNTVFYGKILDFSGAMCKDFARYIPYESAFYNDAKAAGAALPYIERFLAQI